MNDNREQLLKISKIAVANAEWPDVLQEIAAASVGIAGADRVALILWDAPHDEYEIAADAWSGATTDSAVGLRVPEANWAAGRACASSRESAVLSACDFPGLTPAQVEAARRAGSGMLLLPLSVGKDLLGFAVLLREGAMFTIDEIRVGAELSEQLAPAIANARVLDRSRRQSDAQAALFRISQVAISIHDQQTVLREIAKATASVLNCDCCAIELWHRDADEMETVTRECGPERLGSDVLPGRYTLRDHRSLRFALENQTPLQVHPDQVGLTEAELESLNRTGHQSRLIVPMVIAGDTLGAIALSSRRPRAFDSDALSLAQEIAAQTALAIQNARFVDRTKRHAEEQAALLKVSQAVISRRSLREVLAEIARAGLGLDGAEGVRILLWHPATEQVELTAEENVADWQTFYQIGDRYPIADWPTQLQAMHSGMPKGFLISDNEVSARERANHVADGIKSLYIIPIMIGEECLGTLTLHARQLRRFSAESVRVGRELAAQAAHAIDRARLVGQLQARAESDGLTGLLNHRAAFETLDRELMLAKRNGGAVGLIVIDLDDFKLFNDTHGHLIGDKVLVEVSAALRETVRPRDYVARYGGDEFLLILPNATEGTAKNIAE